jgi:hypothetical protein
MALGSILSDVQELIAMDHDSPMARSRIEQARQLLNRVKDAIFNAAPMELWKRQEPTDAPAVFAGYTQSRLDAAFSAVQDKENWKKPIAAIINSKDLAVTIAAISFFAGCSSSVVVRDDGTCSISAIGYYQAVGP